MIEEQTR